MKNNITILIPTHNRHKYLSRILDYYSGTEYTILVADSSAKEYTLDLPLNVTYYYYPNVDYAEKLNKITQLIKTPYMLFCADDDFWVKESIDICMDFLVNNNDYTSVQGKYIYFTYNNQLTYIPSHLQAESIEYDSIAQRLYSNMENYMPLFYGMHRTKVIKRTFVDSFNSNINHAILIEFLVSIYSLICGKHKLLDCLTYVRNNDSISTPVERDSLKIISKNEKFSKEYKAFILNIVKLIYEKNSTLNGTEIISKAVTLYINKRESIDNNKKDLKRFIKKYFFYLMPIIRNYRERQYIKNTFNQTQKSAAYPHSNLKTKQIWDKISKIIIHHNIDD